MSFAPVSLLALPLLFPWRSQDAVEVRLVPSSMNIPAREASPLELLTGNRRKLPAFAGHLQVDGVDYAIYVPRATSYTIANSGASDDHHDNRSTRIGVDANRDGDLAGEYWFANLPVRIGDRMFAVQAIEPEGRGLVLAPSPTPLRGVVLGRSCPPFSFCTQDGKSVSLSDYRDQILILDVWSYS